MTPVDVLLNEMDADCEVVGVAGCETVGAFGGVRSMVQLTVATRPFFAPGTTACTVNLCAPAARPVYVTGDVQAVALAPSRAQRKVALALEYVQAKVAVVVLTKAAGLVVIVGAAGGGAARAVPPVATSTLSAITAVSPRLMYPMTTSIPQARRNLRRAALSRNLYRHPGGSADRLKG